MTREKEAAYLEKMNEGLAKGTVWERVTELIGLENSRECFELMHPSLENHTLCPVALFYSFTVPDAYAYLAYFR